MSRSEKESEKERHERYRQSINDYHMCPVGYHWVFGYHRSGRVVEGHCARNPKRR